MMSVDLAASQDIEACFAVIEETRMEGIPILNPALTVRCLGGVEWEGQQLFVLLTPWFMNLLLVPHVTSEPLPLVGSKKRVMFPSGPYEFIFGFEPAIGGHWMCSLFSPVLEFSDQDTALACAETVLSVLFENSEEPNPQESEMSAIWRGEYPQSDEAMPDGEVDQEVATGGDIASSDQSAPKTDFSRRGLLTGKLGREVDNAR